MRAWQRVALALIAVLVAPLASAHKESDAYLTLRTDSSDAHRMRGQWDIALRDLDYAIGIDGNHDGAITWGEVKARRAAIETYALSHLVVKGDGLTCALAPTGQAIDEHTDGAYAVVLFDAVCDKNIPSRMTVVYTLMYDIDPYHRGIVTLHAGGHTAGAALGPSHPEASLDLREPDRWGEFTSFLVDGIWHIWTGIDHILFLLSLLFPAVLLRRGGWQPVERFWAACLDVVKIVTAFSVSHSITLTLAVLGLVHVPSRLVESGIALSVLIAALNNIFPLVHRRIWLVAFAFGLIHGLGFASALTGLQLPPGAMAASLGGFSVGVEIGQEAIVLAFLPVAFLVRRTAFYRIGVLRWGSWAIVVIATGWLIERAFDVAIPGFDLLLPN
ncbi:HupE/UreJ family protein [Luteibacter pinisoli]|uniref:HupE/UreJ family protein n=1 Tax=Luteibacter pinisoli TaxID=2589080 RepID=A0A4Y5Z1P3_9GAMM|nr:HupE/UreJ family protein [Luteibacter pinisoli]QDE39131.1 HupE/UreJ family protein [Luteibacter pinisoli]